MNHLTKLFKIMELTRSQPQYGYAVRGMRQDELSNLAEHHYLVTFFGWQLALEANARGAKLDVLKVVEYCMVHDLGELFGGDISMVYARANKKAKALAKAFELENQNFLSRLFGAQKAHFKNLANEILEPKTDEALLAKLADYVEATHFLLYAKDADKQSLEFVMNLKNKLQEIKDEKAREFCLKFLDYWADEFFKLDPYPLLVSRL